MDNELAYSIITGIEILPIDAPTNPHIYHNLHVRTRSCIEHRNTHTSSSGTYSAVWPKLLPVCRSEAPASINTASEANTQNTDRRDRLLFEGTETGGRGGGDTSVGIWYISLYHHQPVKYNR